MKLLMQHGVSVDVPRQVYYLQGARISSAAWDVCRGVLYQWIRKNVPECMRGLCEIEIGSMVNECTDSINHWAIMEMRKECDDAEPTRGNPTNVCTQHCA